MRGIVDYTCKDGLSGMCDLPPTVRSRREAPPRRRRARPRPRSSGEPLQWRPLMERCARASSPAAAARSFVVHRERLQRRGHVGGLGSVVEILGRAMSDNNNTVSWWLQEHQYSNRHQVMGQAIGSPCCLMPLRSHVTGDQSHAGCCFTGLPRLISSLTQHKHNIKKTIHLYCIIFSRNLNLKVYF